MSEDFPEYDDASFLEHVAQNDYMIDVDFTPEGRRLLAIAKRLEGGRLLAIAKRLDGDPAPPPDVAPTPPVHDRAEAMREACVRACDKAAAESASDERDTVDYEVATLACEARRTATYLSETIRALPLPPLPPPTPPAPPLDPERVRLAMKCIEMALRWDASHFSPPERRRTYDAFITARNEYLNYCTRADAGNGGK